MTKSSRFDHIDALRAIAALMVILLHASELVHLHVPGIPVEGIIRNVVAKFDFGRAGVVLFFAISGFVIPSSLKPGDAAAIFPVRRFLRLYPAYWLSILTGLIAVHWMWGDAPSLGSILLNLTMVQHYFGVDDVLGTFWTLQVELAFYVLCAGLWYMRLLDNTRLLALIALVSGIYWYFILASGLGMHGWFLPLRPAFDGYYLEWFAYLSIMCMGASCRRHMSGDMRGLGLTCLAIWLWLVVQPALGIYLYRHNITREFVALKYGGYGIGLWAFFLFGFVLRIRNPVMSWLGRISYSLYLQHLPIVYLAIWLILRSGLEAPLTAGTWALIVTAVTIGFSALTYRYVEAPGIALSDRLTQAIRKREPGRS